MWKIVVYQSGAEVVRGYVTHEVESRVVWEAGAAALGDARLQCEGKS